AATIGTSSTAVETNREWIIFLNMVLTVLDVYVERKVACPSVGTDQRRAAQICQAQSFHQLLRFIMAVDRPQTDAVQCARVDLDRTDEYRCLDQSLYFTPQLLCGLVRSEGAHLQIQAALQCRRLRGPARRPGLSRGHRGGTTVLLLPDDRVDPFHPDAGSTALGKAELDRPCIGQVDD